MNRMLDVILVLVAIATVANGYGIGPPVSEGICLSMTPTGHGAGAQTSAAPFEIVVSDQCYKAGSILKARLRIKDANMEKSYFEGFFILARKTDSSTTNYGTFDSLSTAHTQTLDCDSTTAKALGHSNTDDNHNQYLARTFQWTAPNSDVGTLRFVATVVREKEEFWMNVMSADIVYNSNCVVTATLADETYDDFEVGAACDSSSASEECDSAQAIYPHVVMVIITMMLAVFTMMRY